MSKQPDPRVPWYEAVGEVHIEKKQSGKPHAGKVLAAVQAHADDIPFFCAGLVAKLVDEGYTAYLIQTTNDEKCGPHPVSAIQFAATRKRLTSSPRNSALSRSSI